MIRNAELFCQIADWIEVEPEAHDQHAWSSDYDADEPDGGLAWVADHACGGFACIAGWAVHLTHYSKRPDILSLPHDWPEEPVPQIAQALLGLDRFEAGLLFSSHWEPPTGMTVPEALRVFADGAPISSGTKR